MPLAFLQHDDVEEDAIDGDQPAKHGKEPEQQPDVAPRRRGPKEKSELGSKELHVRALAEKVIWRRP